MDKDILIVAQVVGKLFTDVEKRLPVEEGDEDRIKDAILKIYKGGLLAQNLINKIK